MRFHRISAALLAAAAFALAQPAAASGVFSWIPEVRVQISGVESQAKLAAQLNTQGYDHITLTPIYPTLENPHPELNPGAVNDPGTPVHTGWNGIAHKDGQTVQVYATRS
jgi:hypothetical protein